MSRDLILGELHPDLVCAVALGIVEHPRVVLTLEAVTLNDARLQSLGTQTNWLGTDDPLDMITREYLQARREAMQASAKRPGGSWEAAKASKAREAANMRATQAKARGRSLLAERGVLAHARRLGLVVME